MKFVDLHCDTIYKMMYDENSNLRKNDFSVDIERLKKGDCLLQTFALFVDAKEEGINNPYERCKDMGSKFYEHIKLNDDLIGFVSNYDDIIKNKEQNKMSALLSIEGGEVLNSNIKNLKEFYDLGVRMLTLTWNHENELGYPHNRGNLDNMGLKSFGIEVVEKMDELKMIIDVSHLSDPGFYDVLKYSKNPFIASHSNSRTMKNHTRNLTDDMIKLLANRGGITGINFFSLFIGDDEKNTHLKDILAHIKHIRNIGGVDVLSIGTDFDGIDSNVEIKDVSEMDKLYVSLKEEKFTDDEIEKIFYKNALRVIKDVL